jgi:hypothetical protein
MTNSCSKCSIIAIELIQLKQWRGAQSIGVHVRAKLRKSGSGRTERKENIYRLEAYRSKCSCRTSIFGQHPAEQSMRRRVRAMFHAPNYKPNGTYKV